MHPRFSTLSATRELSGTIAPIQNISLSNSLAEPAAAVNVNEGDRVHAGQILAVLDTADLQANYHANLAGVAQAEANVRKEQAASTQTVGQSSGALNSARAALDQARQKLALDRQTLERDRTLLRQSYIPQQTYDTQATTVQSDVSGVQSAAAALRTAEVVLRTNGSGDNDGGILAANVAADRASVAVSRAQAAQLQAQISRATITAPVDAIVVNRNLNPGEFPNGRTLFVLQQTGSVYAVFNVSPAQLPGIRKGVAAAVRPSDGSTGVWHGPVEAILGQTTPGSSNFTVKVLLADPAGQLISGLPVNGDIGLAPVRGLQIPRSAFTDATESAVIQVVRGTTHITPVSVTAENAANAVVTGLNAAAQVVRDGDASLGEGQTVTVR